MSPATLQELVEDVAQQLNSPAVIEDDELRMVAYSPHGVLIDDIRRDSILIKHAPAAVSPMFQKTGSGGVGLGQNSVLGNQFGAYADLVIRRVTDKWQTNGLAGMHTAPLVVVTFDILRDGSVRNVKIAQTSGVDLLDISTVRAVNDAAPFPPLPPQYNRSEAGVELRFQLQR